MSSSFSCSPGLSLVEELVVCDSLSRLMIFSYTCSMTFLTWSMSLADRRSLGGRGGIEISFEADGCCSMLCRTDNCTTWLFAHSNTRNYTLTSLEFLHQKTNEAGGRMGFCWTWAYFSEIKEGQNFSAITKTGTPPPQGKTLQGIFWLSVGGRLRRKAGTAGPCTLKTMTRGHRLWHMESWPCDKSHILNLSKWKPD